MTSTRIPEHAEIPPPRVEEVGDGVFAYVQMDGSWGLNNTGFIAGKDAVTAIDTCFTEARSRAFAEAIQRTAGRPVRTLINTHHHGDHTHGNFVFGPGATIIGHELCRSAVIETGHSTTGLFPGVDWGDIQIAPPNVTFADRLTAWVDDIRLELIFVGPAHTTNDVVVWLPEQRLLFAGDIIFHQGTPFALMGSVAGWLEALDVLRGLGIERIVPGHGPVCGPEAIEHVDEYLRFVQDVARAGVEAGVGPLEAARSTDLGKFGDLLDNERLAGNLHRAYSELRGEPRGAAIDMGSAVGDMVAYNGGQMPRCLA